MTAFSPLPPEAAWRHEGARTGVEVGHFSSVDRVLVGCTTAVEDDHTTWAVSYEISLYDDWRTRSARVTCRSAAGERRARVHADGDGHWTVDGRAVPDLDGCLDVDLESSAMTNTFPVHRLDLAVGETAYAPAVYVRVDGTVERLEQQYTRIGEREFAYAAPAFDFAATLRYDASGLVVDYPGIATRLV